MGFLSYVRERWARAAQPPEPSNKIYASVPVGTGRARHSEYDLRQLIDEGYRRNVVMHCCVNEIAASASEPKLLARKKSDKTEAKGSPLQDLLDSPHPDISKFTLFETSLIHLLTAGNAYIHKGRNSAGQVIRLTPLRPDRMKPIPAPDGTIGGYEFSVEGMNPQYIPRRDVISVPLPDPINDFYGLPPVVVCAKFLEIDNEAALYMRDFFMNGGIPAGLIKLKTIAKPEERERIRAQWQTLFGRGGGRDRDSSGWHTVGVINGDVEYQDVGTTPEKLKMDAIWGMTESRICATFRVPAVVVQMRIGLQMSTYSNYAEARRSFWGETLSPIYGRFDERLTLELATEFGDDLEVFFDLTDIDALQDTEDALNERAVKLYAAGIRTLNEVREMIGDEPLEVDMIVKPNGCVTVDSLADPPVPPAGLLPPGGDPDAITVSDAKPQPKALPPGDTKKPTVPAPKQKTSSYSQVELLEACASSGGDVVWSVVDARAGDFARTLSGFSRDARARMDADALEGVFSAARGRKSTLAGAEKAIGFDAWRARYQEALALHLRAVVDDTVEQVSRIMLGEAFAKPAPGARDPKLAQWIDTHVAEEVGKTYKEGRDTIREQVLLRLQGKTSAKAAVAEIKDVIGLNRQQAKAVDSLRARLKKEGKPDDAIKKSIDRYSAKLLTQRAQVIAEHETARAAAEAQRITWSALADAGKIPADTQKVWISQEETCPICEDLDGQQVPLDGVFSSEDGDFEGPPEPHPNCRCKLALVKG